MMCEASDICPQVSEENCKACKEWYRSYISECKKRGLQPTLLKQQRFSSDDYIPKGEIMKKIKPKKKETSVDEAVERIKKQAPRERLIDAQTMADALKAAYQQGRADALKEIEIKKITLEEVMNEFLPKIKENA